MLLYRTLRKVTGTNMRKTNMYVLTSKRSSVAAAVVSTLVLRRQTKEYTHPYYMMHRRLPTAGIEVARHYHQLLVSSSPDKLFLCFVWGYLDLRWPEICGQKLGKAKKRHTVNGLAGANKISVQTIGNCMYYERCGLLEVFVVKGHRSCLVST